MTKTKTSTFRAFPHDLRIVIEPQILQLQDTSGRVVQQGRKTNDVQFNDHVLETDDPKVIEYLRDHEMFNTPRGFWEDGNAPDEPKPTKKDRSKEISKAIRDDDLVTLRAIRADEVGGHNRRDILDQVDAAIAAIEVPLAEQHGKVGRADEPAEFADAVPKVDPSEPPKLEPEIEREKVIKSPEVAENRAAAQTATNNEEPEDPPATPIEEQLAGEAEAASAQETEKVSEGDVKIKSNEATVEGSERALDGVPEEPPPSERPEPKPAAKKKAAKKSAAKKKATANTGQRTTADATSEGDGSGSK